MEFKRQNGNEMKKQALSIEQMNHLRKLGLDTRDASFCWSVRTGLPNQLLPYNDEVFERCAVTMTMPAYTLQDLLDKLPKWIIHESKKYFINLSIVDGKIGYWHTDIHYGFEFCKYYWFKNEGGMLDAAYELLVWCIEEGHVKTEGGGNA